MPDTNTFVCCPQLYINSISVSLKGRVSPCKKWSTLAVVKRKDRQDADALVVKITELPLLTKSTAKVHKLLTAHFMIYRLNATFHLTVSFHYSSSLQCWTLVVTTKLNCTSTGSQQPEPRPPPSALNQEGQDALWVTADNPFNSCRRPSVTSVSAAQPRPC